MAFVYDSDGGFEARVNPESVIWQRIQTDHYDAMVRDLIAQHLAQTQSKFAQQILSDWPLERQTFWQVVPKEMVHRLEHPITEEAEDRMAQPAE